MVNAPINIFSTQEQSLLDTELQKGEKKLEYNGGKECKVYQTLVQTNPPPISSLTPL
jgi:hypothetical protein